MRDGGMPSFSARSAYLKVRRERFVPYAPLALTLRRYAARHSLRTAYSLFLVIPAQAGIQRAKRSIRFLRSVSEPLAEGVWG